MRASAFAACLALALLAGCTGGTDPGPGLPADGAADPAPAPAATAAQPATPTPVETSCEVPSAASLATAVTCDPGKVAPDAGAFTTGTATLDGQPAQVPATLQVLDSAGDVLGEATGPLPLTVTLAKVPAGPFTPTARVSQTGATVVVEGVVTFRFA